MKKRQASFGSIEVLLEKDGSVVSELLTFEKEGRGHPHEQWEICHVVDGGGVIVIGEEERSVSKGSICKIPPHTTHWMKPDPIMQTLLVYSDKDNEALLIPAPR